MAQVTFIQKNWFVLHGPMHITSLLKKYGHRCEMLIEPAENDLIRQLKRSQPDIIAFSLVTNEYMWAINLAKMIKQNLNCPIIFGGIHPTFCPAECIRQPYVDIVCIGEGEYAMLELLNKLNSDKKIPTTIANLWVKQDGEVFQNPVRPLIEDLDAIPMPDRSIYYSKYATLADYPVKNFMTGRGCPFECSYCCNKGLKHLYKGKGRMLRRRTPDSIIEEIKAVKANWPLRMVEFNDDEFAYDKKWLGTFIDRYKNKIKLPFSCLARIDLLDEETIKILADGGCFALHFGIESGNEHIRKYVLNKNISNKEILDKARLLKKYKLKFNTYNMLNIPGETIEDGLDTVRLNAKIKTDYPWCSLLQPYPGTEIWANMFKDAKVSDELFSRFSFHQSNPVESVDSNKLKNLHKLFFIAVKAPRFLKLVKILVCLPPNVIFNIIFLATFGYRHMRANNLSFLETIKFNSRHIGGYFKNFYNKK